MAEEKANIVKWEDYVEYITGERDRYKKQLAEAQVSAETWEKTAGSLGVEATRLHDTVYEAQAELARYEKEEVTQIELANMQKRIDELEILQEENADLRKQLAENEIRFKLVDDNIAKLRETIDDYKELLND